MKKNLIILLLSFLALNLISEVTTAQTTGDKFARASHTFKGTSLPYRIFIPEDIDLNKKYPVVLALHGMGERGSDNNMQITVNKMATSWAEPDMQLKNPCYVIAPQCPITSSDWSSNPVKDVLLNLVDSVLTQYNIDTDRVYITGLSMGGNGTWNCISVRPDLFAAAVPIAGWGGTYYASVIKNIPIWAYHGQSDNVVAVESTRSMVDAIVKKGVEAVYTNCYYMDSRIIPILKLKNEIQAHSSLFYTELFGYYHDVWDNAYGNKYMFDWVFSKRKFIANAITLSSLMKDTIAQGSIPIKWKTMFPKDSVEIWFKSDRQDYWKLLSKVNAGNKIYNWNTDNEIECIYGKFRLCLVDSNSRVYSQSESAFITIDQATNGKPYVKLKTPAFYKSKTITSKSINVNFIANDVESDSVWVVFNYSTNLGKTFVKIDSVKVIANNTMKMRPVLFSNLTNTTFGILKLMVYDENRLYSFDSTISFTNQLGLFPLSAPLTIINDGFAISEPYPNPADQLCTISLDMPISSDVNVYVYSTLGQLVIQKYEGLKSSGKQNIQLKTAQLPVGIYYCKVIFGSKYKSNKLVKSKKIRVQH